MGTLETRTLQLGSKTFKILVGKSANKALFLAPFYTKKLGALYAGMNEYFFSCLGGFDIDKNLKVGRDYMYSPVCFHLPDGREVDLFVGLRVRHPDGTEEYLHQTKDFEALGFYNQSYEEAEFTPVADENEDYEEEYKCLNL